MLPVITDEHLMELIELSNKEVIDWNSKYEEQMQIVDRESEQWQERLERLYEFVETRSIDPSRMSKRIVEVQDKMEQLKQTKLGIEESRWARRAEQVNPQKVLAYVRELREFIDVKGVFDRKSFLRTFVKSIEADDDKMTFNYSLPLPPDYST